MIYIFVTILIVYVITIGLLIYGFDKIETTKNSSLSPKISFSIIVPFRNEETNFLNLLKSISELEYPKNWYEIIVVNDNSDDNSVSIFNKWKLENPIIQSRLLENIRVSHSPKKDAVATAISQVKNEWIITTDADCIVGKNWLLAFDSFIQSNDLEMIVSAVILSPALSRGEGAKTRKNIFAKFLNYFQFVDMLSLQGTTIGSFGLENPFMCNGANFAYTKNLFLELNGFDGNDKIASGDDVFLLQKAIQFRPEKIGYLKNSESIVFTKPEENWSKLFFQRVRWASKTGSYNGFFGKFLAVIVFITNLSFVLGFVFGFWGFGFWVLGFGFVIKLLVDLILINKTNLFIGSQKFIFPIIASLFYPFFCISVGIYSFFGDFDWKERSFRK